MTRKYQIGSDPTAKELEALEQSIRLKGVLQPVWVDETGQVIDGYYRQKIAKRLGIKHETKVVRRLSESEKISLAYALNFVSRNANPTRKDRREGAIALLKACPDLADKAAITVAKICGLGRSTISKLRTELVAKGEIPAASTVVRRDGRQIKKAVRQAFTCRSERETEKLLGYVAEGGDKIKWNRNPLKVKYQVRQIQREEQAAAALAAAAGKSLPRQIDLRTCDFRDLKIELGSVDLVCTDVVWMADHADDWKALGNLAAKWLKPNGVFCTLIGQNVLPHFLEAFGKTPLHYQTMMMYLFSGTTKVKNKKNYVLESFRPILVYSKNPKHHFAGIIDRFESDGPRKEQHLWQQTLSVVTGMVDHLSPKGPALIVDPQFGSGSTAVSCSLLGKRFIGCDIDPACKRRAEARVITEGKIRGLSAPPRKPLALQMT